MVNYEPNEETKKAMEEAMKEELDKEKIGIVSFQDLLDELRKDREERSDEWAEMIAEARTDKFISSVDGSEYTFDEMMEMVFKDHKEVLDKLGSDYDENGIPYWDKGKDEKE